MTKQTQQGFTLIELIVVIVILGILAAVAIPRFVDFGSEARTANLRATAGALRAAANMGYGIVQLSNSTDARGAGGAYIPVPGLSDEVHFTYGWPTASSTGIGAMLVDPDEDNWNFTPSGTPPYVRFELQSGCYVTYTESNSTDNPARISTNSTGC